MVSAEILKKNNLKAVPFEKIREGQTFLFDYDIEKNPLSLNFFIRQLAGQDIIWADGSDMAFPDKKEAWGDRTVYVPVWRPC
jgi:hypothetical protein